MPTNISFVSTKVSIGLVGVLMLMSSWAVGQSDLQPFEDCNCPEDVSGKRCQFELFLDSIRALEGAIIEYDATFVPRNYAFIANSGAREYARYDCEALVDSISSLNVQLTNAMGCADSESCNYNPQSTSMANCQYPTTWYYDGDGDGLGRMDSTETACSASVDFVGNSSDNCDNLSAYNYSDPANGACILPPDPNALAPSGLNGETATINGSVDNPSELTITEVGFYFNTDSLMPAGTNTTYVDTLMSGVLDFDVSALTIGVTYYYQVFVTTSYGTVVSDTYSFIASAGPCQGLTSVTDFDGNLYSLVEVDDQCWMGENLRSTHYTDGTSVGVYRTLGQSISTEPQYWVYNDDPEVYLDVLGYAYNAGALSPVVLGGTKHICPAGFSIPTNDAWNAVKAFAEGLSESTAALQELMSPSYWNGVSPGTGLNLTATGLRYSDGSGDVAGSVVTDFTVQLRSWHASSSPNIYTTSGFSMVFGESNVPPGGQYFGTTGFPDNGGAPVRCIKTSTDVGVVE